MISCIFGMMVDLGLEFYSDSMIPPQGMTLRSRYDLEVKVTDFI